MLLQARADSLAFQSELEPSEPDDLSQSGNAGKAMQSSSPSASPHALQLDEQHAAELQDASDSGMAVPERPCSRSPPVRA